MTIPNSSGAMGNVLRLQGLKNVGGRRVMPGSEFLQDLEQTLPGISGTSSPPPQMPKSNMPEPDMGGELTPQSYDVRANSVSPEVQDPSFWSKFGSALGSAFSASKQQQVPPPSAEYHHAGNPVLQPAQEQGLPPIIPNEQNEEPNVLQRFGKWFKEGWTPSTPEQVKKISSTMPPMDLLSVPPIIKNTLGFGGALLPDTFGNVDKQQQWEKFREDQEIRSQGLDPTTTREEKQQQLASGVEAAMEEPYENAVYGANAVVASHPALQEQFKEITGIDYEPQIAKQISDYELAMKGVEDSLNGIQTSLSEQENQIKERILNNQSTDADMYYIGLALLMPLLIGGFFGKEAGLGALAGGAQGVAEGIGRRQKDIRSDESALLDIARQKSGNEEKRASMALEGSQLRPKLMKALPENPRSHLLGRQEVTWWNPETEKPERAVEILPGLVAKESFIATPEGLAKREKAAEELSATKSFVEDLDQISDDIIKIAAQLKDQSGIGKLWNSRVASTVPGSLSYLTQQVDLDGRKVNAGLVLDEKIALLNNAYAQAEKLGQLDRAAQAHLAKIVTNPTASLSSAKDTINAMLELRKLTQGSMLNNAKNKGFIPEFIQREYDKKNSEVFSRLNKKENDRELNDILQESSRSGTSYAK